MERVPNPTSFPPPLTRTCSWQLVKLESVIVNYYSSCWSNGNWFQGSFWYSLNTTIWGVKWRFQRKLRPIFHSILNHRLATESLTELSTNFQSPTQTSITSLTFHLRHYVGSLSYQMLSLLMFAISTKGRAFISSSLLLNPVLFQTEERTNVDFANVLLFCNPLFCLVSHILFSFPVCTRNREDWTFLVSYFMLVLTERMRMEDERDDRFWSDASGN